MSADWFAKSPICREPQMDRRGSDRRRVLLAGRLVYGLTDFTADCMIRDLTETGARVRLRTDVLVHEPVWLIERIAGIAHGATIVWRRPPELGLHFEQSIDLNQPIAGPLRHLRRLWLDFTGR